MQQLTKPEILEGNKVVNIQLNDLEIIWIHEALTNKVRNAKNTEESSVQGMMKLREEFNKIRILFNPS